MHKTINPVENNLLITTNSPRELWHKLCYNIIFTCKGSLNNTNNTTFVNRFSKQKFTFIYNKFKVKQTTKEQDCCINIKKAVLQLLNSEN